MGSRLSNLASSEEGESDSRIEATSGTASRRQMTSPATKINEWIEKKMIAPQFRAIDSTAEFCHECPICFIDYAAINQTRCCSNTICTDCFAQLLSKAEPVMCPFCTEKIKLSYSESHDVDAESNQRRSTLCVSSEPNENHKSTLSMVFSTPEARRELEAEMYAHRHAAGDLEDISTLDRRARAVSQGSRRSVHMNRVGIGLRGAATSNRIPQNRVISDDDETEQSLRRPQSLSYLQARASSGSRGQRDSSVASSGSQAEWVALHDMLVSSRHDSIGISASDLLRLEESMLSQAMQQSLLASGVAEDMDRSCVFTDARSTPAEEIQQHTEIRLSDLSLISDNDLDEEALLELALALSLQNDESTAM